MSFGGGSGGGGSIQGSTDVALNNPSDSQVLGYNASLQKWQNQTASGNATDASTSAKGVVQLAGDLGGTAATPTVPGLAGKLASANNLSDVADPMVSRRNLYFPHYNLDAYVAKYGGNNLGTVDCAPAITQLMNDIGLNPGVVELGIGTYKTSITLKLYSKQSLIGHSSGTSTLNYIGSGDAVRAKPSTTVTANVTGGGGTYRGFTLDGTGSTGSASGFHYGDLSTGTLDDVNIRAFTGTNSIGLWLDNTQAWTEGTHAALVGVSNCTNCVVFDRNSNGDNTSLPGQNSYDYSRYNFKLNANANQNGLVFRNSVYMVGAEIHATGNFQCGNGGNTGVALVIAPSGTSDVSTLMGVDLNLNFETDSTNASYNIAHTTFTIGSGGIIKGRGILNFQTGGGNYGFIDSGYDRTSGKIQFAGWINTDGSLGRNAFNTGFDVLGAFTQSAGYVNTGTGTTYNPQAYHFEGGNMFSAGRRTGVTIATFVGTVAKITRAVDINLRQANDGSGGRYVWPSYVFWGNSNQQLVTLWGAPTGGSWAIGVNGQQTVLLAYNASAATVQAALVTILGTGLVTVTGSNGGPYTVSFDPTLGATVVFTPIYAGLTGGTTPIVTAENVGSPTLTTVGGGSDLIRLITYDGSVYYGALTNAGAASGSSSLAGDSDVAITSVVDRNILAYDAGSGKWLNKAPSAVTMTPTVKIKSGYYCTPANSGTTSTSASWTLGSVYFAALDVSTGQSFSGLGCSVSTLGVGGTTPLIHMGLYADDGTSSAPTGSPITGSEVSFDPTANTAGDKYNAWSSALILAPGRYWVAWSLTSSTAFTTTPTLVTIVRTANVGMDVLTNVSHKPWQQSGSASASSLPVVGTLLLGGGSWPQIGMKAV